MSERSVFLLSFIHEGILLILALGLWRFQGFKFLFGCFGKIRHDAF